MITYSAVTLVLTTISVLVDAQEANYSTTAVPIVTDNNKTEIVGNKVIAYPCKGNDNLVMEYELGLPYEQRNKYTLIAREIFLARTRIYLRFSVEGVSVKWDPTVAFKIRKLGSGVIFLQIYSNLENLRLYVAGPVPSQIPYLTSFVTNEVESCEHPNKGILERVQSGAVTDKGNVTTCGQRKVEHTELITEGVETKPGDWPWHVALFRQEFASIKYICGGTLVSKNLVLTAAHCVTIRGAPVPPEALSVVLGKYNLIGGDTGAQDREIDQVIVHENFKLISLDNDIALMKLKSEALYTDYVQPACIWNDDFYQNSFTADVFGTVVGWGFDETSQPSKQLRQATVPKVSESVCIQRNPLFYSRMLTERKFCAGHINGTSPCNGDSGGGFMMFVVHPTSKSTSGSWQVRGIVSMSPSRRDISVCDPTQYVIFTDVAKYTDWLQRHMT